MQVCASATRIGRLPGVAEEGDGAFPIQSCEIGDDDPEARVDARIHGRGSLRYADWARSPQPVVDLRFEIQAHRLIREKTFKVYDQKQLDRLLRDLAGAAANSFVEMRSYRGDVLRLAYRGDVLRLTPVDTDVAERAAAFIVARLIRCSTSP